MKGLTLQGFSNPIYSFQRLALGFDPQSAPPIYHLLGLGLDAWALGPHSTSVIRQQFALRMVNALFCSGAKIWVVEASQMDASCFCHWLPIKTLGTESQVSVLDWQHFGAATHYCWEIKFLSEPPRRELLTGLWPSPPYSFPLLIFNLNPPT